MLVVLQLEEAMGQQLDDHIVMLQSMGFSPYKKPFEDRLAKWDTMLNLVRTCNMRRIDKARPCDVLCAVWKLHRCMDFECRLG
jgi:hypothetical protein